MKNRPKISIINSVLEIIIAASLLCLLMISCSPRVEYVPLETVKKDTVYQSKIRVDSILQRDSIYLHVFEKGDTVYSEKIRYKYRDRMVITHDTIYRSKNDTIRVPYPVERKLTKWEKVQKDVGKFSTCILLAFAILAAIRLIIHHFMKR